MRQLALPTLALAVIVWPLWQVNRSNYVFTQGHYAPGLHVISNLLDYTTSLYVGRHDPASLGLTGLALVAAVVWGRGTLRFGASWILLTLIPYCFFTWGNADRYLYLPAVGFSLVIADVLSRLATAPVLSSAWGPRVAVILALLVSLRDSQFGRKAARDAAWRTDPYREYVAQVRVSYPNVPAANCIEAPLPLGPEPAPLYLEPLLRVAYDEAALVVRRSVGGCQVRHSN